MLRAPGLDCERLHQWPELAGAASYSSNAVATVGGFVVVSLRLATGQVAVATVLSSLPSAITVGFACVLLGEWLAAGIGRSVSPRSCAD